MVRGLIAEPVVLVIVKAKALSFWISCGWRSSVPRTQALPRPSVHPSVPLSQNAGQIALYWHQRQACGEGVARFETSKARWSWALYESRSWTAFSDSATQSC